MSRKAGISGILVIAAVAIVVMLVSNSRSVGDQDIKQLVQFYSSGKLNNGEQFASITSHQLIVTGAGEQLTVYDLPEDEFFVSIAPYVHQTHPCAIHNLTGCRGELPGEPFEVYIVDQEGRTVVNESVDAQPNGFIDLWLPRDRTYLVTIRYDGLTAEAELSTYEGDQTCVTTMQLIAA